MKDYNFSFFRNVYLEFFIQGFYQHLTELGQLNWLDKSALIIEFSFLYLCRTSVRCDFIGEEGRAPGFSCESCKISKNTFSYRTFPVAASVNKIFQNANWLLLVAFD